MIIRGNLVWASMSALLGILLIPGCDAGPSDPLKRQVNTTIKFYGLTVDQNGHPLPNAHVEYELEAYPKDWTFDTRGRPNDMSTVKSTSDTEGRFQFEVTGCLLRTKDISRVGYRHLWEQDTSDGRPSTYAYQLIAWSDPWYKSDPEHPAVYVFVKDGVYEVSSLPCKGGYDSGAGKRWTLNKPGWPRNPSLKDVAQRKPTTAP